MSMETGDGAPQETGNVIDNTVVNDRNNFSIPQLDKFHSKTEERESRFNRLNLYFILFFYQETIYFNIIKGEKYSK